MQSYRGSYVMQLGVEAGVPSQAAHSDGEVLSWRRFKREGLLA